MIDYEFGGVNYQHSFNTLADAQQWFVDNQDDELEMLVILANVDGDWVQTDECLSILFASA